MMGDLIMAYLLYLRKSRADLEAEARGEGETLKRHERQLLDLAKKQKLSIGGIYKEIVSGESIAARPIMQQLLTEVEQGLWEGVIVMEVERLARGNTLDQGIVAQAFQYSNTKIVTPMKTYDPNNEFDQEFFEFGLFMSRREYKTINRRLQSGRSAATKEGKWVSNKAPYGYKRVKLEHDSGFSLEIIPEEAEVIKLIYDLYVTNKMGPDNISKQLEHLGYKSPSNTSIWSSHTIRDILINPTYCGKIRWGWRAHAKTVSDGEIKVSRPRSENFELSDGLHEPIISDKLFNLAQEIRDSNSVPRINPKCKIKNPLSGIIFCSECGRTMTRRPYNQSNQPASLICQNPRCKNISSALHLVEEELLNLSNLWLKQLILKLENLADDDNQTSTLESAIKKSQNELQTLEGQMDNLYNLLEQGIYSNEVFLERSKKLSLTKQEIVDRINVLEGEFTQEQKNDINKEFIPRLQKLIDTYYTLNSVEEQNILLKSTFDRVIYKKSEGGRGKEKAFTLEIYPFVPKC